MDATVMDLCLSLFPWAKFRQTKGAVKVHLLLGQDGYFPIFAHITDGHGGDSRVCKDLVAMSTHLTEGSILALNRGYIDLALIGLLISGGSYFVTRLKEGPNWLVRGERAVPSRGGIMREALIEVQSSKAQATLGQHLLRLVEWQDPNTGEKYRFLTNHLEFGPTTIMRIYKD
ncbi:MAG TPA: transposase [Bacteroidota bacterium]|nr:transposase [Bacteroidota bacterium]